MNIANYLGAAVVPDWVSNSFPTIRLIMIIVLVILSAIMVVAVLLQESNSEGIGAIGGQDSETFYSKNKAKTTEGMFKRLTVGIGIAIFVISVLFFVTVLIYKAGI